MAGGVHYRVNPAERVDLPNHDSPFRRDAKARHEKGRVKFLSISQTCVISHSTNNPFGQRDDSQMVSEYHFFFRGTPVTMVVYCVVPQGDEIEVVLIPSGNLTLKRNCVMAIGRGPTLELAIQCARNHVWMIQ